MAKRTVQKTGRTLLYYPTIKVPSGSWLKQAILYWDEVASIVPGDWHEETLIPFTPEIEYLLNEGVFRPIRPESLARSWDDVHEFEKEIRALVGSRGFTRMLGPKSGWIVDAPIHINKISKQLVHHIEELGLASTREARKGDSKWYTFERRTD